MREINHPINGLCHLRDLRGDSIIAIPRHTDGSMIPLFNITIADGEAVTQVYNLVSGMNFRIKFENDNYVLCFTNLRLYRANYFPEANYEILLDPISVEEWLRNINSSTQQVPMEIQ